MLRRGRGDKASWALLLGHGCSPGPVLTCPALEALAPMLCCRGLLLNVLIHSIHTEHPLCQAWCRTLEHSQRTGGHANLKTELINHRYLCTLLLSCPGQ